MKQAIAIDEDSHQCHVLSEPELFQLGKLGTRNGSDLIQRMEFLLQEVGCPKLRRCRLRLKAELRAGERALRCREFLLQAVGYSKLRRCRFRLKAELRAGERALRRMEFLLQEVGCAKSRRCRLRLKAELRTGEANASAFGVPPSGGGVSKVTSVPPPLESGTTYGGGERFGVWSSSFRRWGVQSRVGAASAGKGWFAASLRARFASAEALLQELLLGGQAG